MRPTPFVFRDKPRYVVTTGKARTVIYEGNNRQKAVDRANFWDERQDTWFEDRRVKDGPLSALFRKFDALTEHVLAGGFG